MEGIHESVKQTNGLARRVLERVWQVISRDSLSLKIAKQWEDVARAAGALDHHKIEAFGKSVAIGGNAVNIVLGVAFGALGTRNILKARREQINSFDTSVLISKIRKDNLKRYAPLIASPFVIGLRPIAWATLLAGKAGKPIAERVVRIVDSITLKKEQKQYTQQVFVGQGKA